MAAIGNGCVCGLSIIKQEGLDIQGPLKKPSIPISGLERICDDDRSVESEAEQPRPFGLPRVADAARQRKSACLAEQVRSESSISFVPILDHFENYSTKLNVIFPGCFAKLFHLVGV